MNLEDTEKAAAARKSLEYVKDGMVVISSTDSIKKELTKPATGRRKAVRKKGKATSRR